MGTKELRKRESWQDTSGPKAEAAENEFYDVFLHEFEGTEFRIRDKPKEFKGIYNDVKLSDEVKAEIYSPEEGYGPLVSCQLSLLRNSFVPIIFDCMYNYKASFHSTLWSDIYFLLNKGRNFLSK